MAESEEIAANVTIPGLPPLPGVAPLVHAPRKGDGQFFPLGSAGTEGSTVSSITNPTATIASSSGAADDTPQKGNITKRKFPDFSRAFSRDYALLSGNESDGWDVELDYIQEQIAAANDAERDDASNMEDPVVEVQEFEYILENNAMDEEGNADDEDTEGGGDVYDSVTVTKKTHTIADLKDICKALSLNTGGNKATIFMRIRDCGSTLIVPIDAESFVFKKIRGGEADLSLPRGDSQSGTSSGYPRY